MLFLLAMFHSLIYCPEAGWQKAFVFAVAIKNMIMIINIICRMILVGWAFVKLIVDLIY